MKTFIFGHSANQVPIPAFTNCANNCPDNFTTTEVLIIGGVHGDEPEGIAAAWGLIDKLSTWPFINDLCLTIIPQFNPDGLLAKTRGNANGVDLNRNLPTRDWSPIAANQRYAPGPFANSESENKALVDFLNSHRPEYIISLHSWNPMLNTNGNCNPIVEVIAAETGYCIQPSIGYPTPGSLGTWGTENDIPVLTYEIERDLAIKKIIHEHPPAILKGLESLIKRKANL